MIKVRHRFASVAEVQWLIGHVHGDPVEARLSGYSVCHRDGISGADLRLWTPLLAEGEYHSAAQVWQPAKSETARLLDSRYGAGWNFAVLERERQGNEILVKGRLTIPGKGIGKTQFGVGAIPGEAGAASVAGSAGGISFALGAGPGAGGGQNPEQRGYRRAIEDALAKCAALL